MGFEVYTVKANDSLSSIARWYYGNAMFWPQIFAYNMVRRHGSPALLQDPNKLRVGQTIWLPPRRSHRLPYLTYRHPAQRTRPVIQPVTEPARPAAASSVLPAPRLARPASGSPAAATANKAWWPKAIAAFGRAHVNTPAYLYDLGLLPPIKGETPEVEFEATYTGQIYIWIDKQIDILTIANKGIQLRAKQETDTALGKMVNSGTVTWDHRTNRVSFENLMTTQAVGGSSILTGVGVVIDSTNPLPAIRVKLTSPRLAGKFPPFLLYLAETVTVTLDVRAKPQPPTRPDAGPQAGLAMTAPHPSPQVGLAMTSPPVHGQGGIAGLQATAAGSSKAWWDRPSILLPGAAILVAATLATNVFTWGADSEVDPATFALAAKMAARAAVAR